MLPGDGQRADAMSERSSQQLASEMHELSVHLWNAFDRERPDYRTSPLRNDVEGIQRGLKTMANWPLVRDTERELAPGRRAA